MNSGGLGLRYLVLTVTVRSYACYQFLKYYLRGLTLVGTHLLTEHMQVLCRFRKARSTQFVFLTNVSFSVMGIFFVSTE